MANLQRKCCSVFFSAVRQGTSVIGNCLRIEALICMVVLTAPNTVRDSHFRLVVKPQKTVSMRYEPEGQAAGAFAINDHQIDDVSSFPYLGSIITPTNNLNAEVNKRIGMRVLLLTGQKIVEEAWHSYREENYSLQCYGHIHSPLCLSYVDTKGRTCKET